MSINCKIIVDVQHTFHFDLDFISDPEQGHNKTLSSCILYKKIRRVVLCVRDSAQTTSHICTHFVPINCTIIVDVQHIFHCDIDFISDPGQGHRNFVFLHTLYKTGGTLCARLSPNRTIIVDVQDTFHFDLDIILDPGQGHNKT